MSYLDPDITGQAPECYVDNDQNAIFTSNQKIEFTVPIYYDTLHIFITGTDNELTKDIDYIKDEIDYTSMAKIKYAYPDFDKELIKSIIIKNNNSQNFNITLKYQQLYPKILDYSYYHGYEQLEFTPELIIEMLDRIKQIEFTMDAVFDPSIFSSQSISQIKIADLDINKTNPNNEITDEEHSINSISGVAFIAPIYGSFFKDSVSIKTSDTNIPFVEGTDYEILGLNTSKTKVTTNQSGVYDFIKIKKEYVGNIKISYHAFGGLPSLTNFKDMYSKLFNVLNYLNKNQLISKQMVSTLPEIISLRNKIFELESAMRNLLTEGTPTYGDVTYGISTKKRISSNNNNLNWWTIASLFKVEGSNSIIMKDLFKFRLELLNSGINLEGSVIFDLTKDDFNEQFRIVINNNNERSNMEKYRLHFRVIYNKDISYYSGALLQIGIALQDYLQETIGIEDLSGKESGWLLIKEPTTVIGPENDNLLLPDGNSHWISTQDISHEIKTIAPLYTGADILNGDIDIPLNSSSYTNLNIYTTINEYLMKATKYIEFQFRLYENGNTSYINLKVPANYYKTSTSEENYVNSILRLVDNREYKILSKLTSSGASMRIAANGSYSSNPAFRLIKMKLFFE